MRKILVTGAGSGLGKAIAERLAKCGDQVVGTVRNEERAQMLTEQAREAQLSIYYSPLEISNSDSIHFLASSLNAQGGVDGVVHNAGFGVFGPIEEVNAQSTLRQFAVNLFGPLELTRLLLPSVRENRGFIIWIGSLGGRLAMPFQAHYAATKAAVASISDSMRMELKPFGVRVCCVEPGDFATGFTDARQDKSRAQSLYQGRLRACLAAINQQESQGANPKLVARQVEKLSKKSNPPARKAVGQWARTTVVLQRIFPDSLREWVTTKYYQI